MKIELFWLNRFQRYYKLLNWSSQVIIENVLEFLTAPWRSSFPNNYRNKFFSLKSQNLTAKIQCHQFFDFSTWRLQFQKFTITSFPFYNTRKMIVNQLEWNRRFQSENFHYDIFWIISHCDKNSRTEKYSITFSVVH